MTPTLDDVVKLAEQVWPGQEIRVVVLHAGIALVADKRLLLTVGFGSAIDGNRRAKLRTALYGAIVALAGGIEVVDCSPTAPESSPAEG